MRRAFLLFLFFAFLFQPALGQTNDHLIVILRVDDILTRNTTILPRSIKPFEAMAEARGAVVTWAVIPHRLVEPANEDGALVSELRATVTRGHEITLHGYTHICRRCNESSHEMYCTRDQVSFSYQTQREMVEDGLNILADHQLETPTSFVPPGHAMDQATYDVIADAGLPVLSVPGAQRRNDTDPVFNLQPHDEFTWAMAEGAFDNQLRRALADVEERGKRDGYYMLLLHDYFIRAGYEDGVVIRWTGAFLDSLKARHGERLRFMTLSEAATHFSRGGVRREQEVLAETPGTFVTQYPNPSSGQLVWQIDSTEPRVLRLSVYDITGRRVGEPFSGVARAGRTEVMWDPGMLAPGTYLFRIDADGYRSAGTFTVTR